MATPLVHASNRITLARIVGHRTYFHLHGQELTPDETNPATAVRITGKNGTWVCDWVKIIDTKKVLLVRARCAAVTGTNVDETGNVTITITNQSGDTNPTDVFTGEYIDSAPGWGPPPQPPIPPVPPLASGDGGTAPASKKG